MQGKSGVKWLALLVCLAGMPPIVGWIRQNRRNYPRVWIVVEILPFLMADLPLYMALNSWSEGCGYVKGAEVSVLDILVLAIYPGLAAFSFMLACPLFVAFSCGHRYSRDLRGDLQPGLGVGLLAVYIHSFFEWSLVTFQARYMMPFFFGSVAGVTQQLGYWRKIQPRDRPWAPAINSGPVVSARQTVARSLLKILIDLQARIESHSTVTHVYIDRKFPRDAAFSVKI